MKFYIATGFDNQAVYAQLRDLLVAGGHSLTLDWTKMEDPETHDAQTSDPKVWADIARREQSAVTEAEMVIVYLPGGRGTHVEMGIALSAPVGRHGPARRVVICAETIETLLRDGKGVPFYHLAERLLTGSLLQLGTELLGLMRVA